MRFSAMRGAFFASDIEYSDLPGDLIEITPEYHASLLAAQSSGAEIIADNNGVPQAVMPAPPTEAEALTVWRATAEVSRFQALAALHLAGKLDDAIAAVEEEGGLTLLAWQNAQVFKRASPMMNALAPALGLDDEALDELFLAAAEIEA